jgi:hypothetical protein
MPEPLARRRFPRFEVHVPFVYSARVPASAVTGAGWTRSLSEGGATVELSQRLRPPTAVQLRLRAEEGIVEADAEVIWSAGRVPAGGLVHGLSFTRIAPGHVKVLRKVFRPLSIMRHAGVRLPLDVPITCQPKNPGGPQILGRTGNVNRGGLFLRLPRLLPPGTALEVTLHTPKEPLTVEGAIVWVEPPEIWKPGESIGHGFRFHAPGWSALASLCLLLVGPS